MKTAFRTTYYQLLLWIALSVAFALFSLIFRDFIYPNLPSKTLQFTFSSLKTFLEVFIMYKSIYWAVKLHHLIDNLPEKSA